MENSFSQIVILVQPTSLVRPLCVRLVVMVVPRMFALMANIRPEQIVMEQVLRIPNLVMNVRSSQAVLGHMIQRSLVLIRILMLALPVLLGILKILLEVEFVVITPWPAIPLTVLLLLLLPPHCPGIQALPPVPHAVVWGPGTRLARARPPPVLCASMVEVHILVHHPVESLIIKQDRSVMGPLLWIHSLVLLFALLFSGLEVAL